MNEKNLINGQKPEFGNLEQIKILQKEQQLKDAEKEYKDFYNNLSPGEKYFDDLMSIDWTMNAIKLKTEQIQNHFLKRSPINIAVDKSTGYDKAVMKGFLLYLKGAYEHLIILFKRIKDKDLIKQYTNLLKKVNKQIEIEFKDVKEVEIQ